MSIPDNAQVLVLLDRVTDGIADDLENQNRDALCRVTAAPNPTYGIRLPEAGAALEAVAG